ncbi:PREDICTED: uncharacterized protein LOC104804153 isoform X2 [Tarenaya hassleriana]|uniref:uncharacterized protein LOC104804153 isoform X2 n=1 Tax=Tarenaya hassleriana TaxID=28532 RepID=UPI00053C7AA4|nr:PREDICTED: uncharacterized protein LOC104804153 isoform X2 [Tarenaya hassleriana]
MDSANSSSMQSSSGGDEEYDSRADQSLSAFLDHRHRHLSGAPPLQQHRHTEQLDFDNSLLSNYFDNNSLLSPSSSSFSFLTRSDPTTSQPGFRPTSSVPRPPPPPPPPQTHQNNIMGVVKRSKKRSRASRRAPTTVLTTDTSNFRAMVQEFTGIPAPPLFSGNVTRLNTFLGLSPSSSSSSASYNLLLRPFGQKLVPTSHPLSSESLLRASINDSQLHGSSGDVFHNLHLQSLLQVPVSNTNPRSDQHEILKTNFFAEGFGLGGLQSTDPPSTSTNRDGDSGGFGDLDRHDDNSLRLITENGGNKEVEDPTTASRNEVTKGTKAV